MSDTLGRVVSSFEIMLRTLHRQELHLEVMAWPSFW